MTFLALLARRLAKFKRHSLCVLDEAKSSKGNMAMFKVACCPCALPKDLGAADCWSIIAYCWVFYTYYAHLANAVDETTVRG